MKSVPFELSNRKRQNQKKKVFKMKSFTLFCVFCSIPFINGSSKIWKCDFDKFISIFTFDYAYSYDCSKIIYKTTYFECDYEYENYDQIEQIKFQNCNLSAINTLCIGKFSSLQRLYFLYTTITFNILIVNYLTKTMIWNIFLPKMEISLALARMRSNIYKKN